MILKIQILLLTFCNRVASLVENVRQQRRVIPLEMNFFVDTAFGYSNNQREATVIADPLLQKKLGRDSPFNVSYQNCCKKTICQ
jgi:hypothetical protein